MRATNVFMTCSSMKCAFIIFLAAASFIPAAAQEDYDVIYGYECKQSRCIKVELSADKVDTSVSLPVCRMFCGSTIGTLWPKPTGQVTFDTFMASIDIDAITYAFPNEPKQAWAANQERFQEMLKKKIPNETTPKGKYLLEIIIETETEEKPRLTLNSDENYKLQITAETKRKITAKITAKSFFGARHGLESLIQLIVYDNIRQEVQMPISVEINDGPIYKWRGFMLDTSRNFYSVKAIKRTLDAMAMAKLNTFHWHITDSQSFPLEMKKHPDLHRLGAYSQRQVYTQRDVQDIVEYGRVRGVRVMPEFDTPSHVGEGWQHKNMTTCFNAQPWKKYCGEPPCGQLDPTVDALYSVLEDIYSELFELFDPDVFHMGGDEVIVSCWNSSKQIQDWMLAKGWGLEESDFIRLWEYFQVEALKSVDRVANEKDLPIILWTSRLTDPPYIRYLDKDRYIIQIWTKGTDTAVDTVLKNGFRVIISNNDGLYFDCGGPSWISSGNNWCSPFIGWQRVYENRLERIADDYHDQVLGAEAAVWSEQIDEFTLDYRLWPRASALAERLWSNPATGWRDAEARILFHRQHLVQNGIGAEALQPEWCLQNENECPIGAHGFDF